MTRTMRIVGALILACIAGCGGSDEPGSLCGGFGLAACDDSDAPLCVNPLYAVCAFHADGSISGVIITFDDGRTVPVSCLEAESGGACPDSTDVVCLEDASDGESPVTRVACE